VITLKSKSFFENLDNIVCPFCNAKIDITFDRVNYECECLACLALIKGINQRVITEYALNFYERKKLNADDEISIFIFSIQSIEGVSVLFIRQKENTQQERECINDNVFSPSHYRNISFSIFSYS
jgi:hypothetical protein